MSASPQIDQFSAWLAGDLYPEHETFTMGRGFAQAIIDEIERLRGVLRSSYMIPPGDAALVARALRAYLAGGEIDMTGRLGALADSLSAAAEVTQTEASADPA